MRIGIIDCSMYRAQAPGLWVELPVALEFPWAAVVECWWGGGIDGFLGKLERD
jgi:hypothetical protein